MPRQIDWTDPDVEEARKILLRTLLESFREHRTATALESALIDDAEQLRDYLVDKDTRTFCILAVSYMEDALRRRFEEQWAIESRSEQDHYFGSNGPLSNFSQRLAVAKGIGWLTGEELQQASLLRRIRNMFAHDHRVREIDLEPIVGLATSLRPLERSWYDAGLKNYVRAYDEATKSTVLRMRVYCNSIHIVSAALTRSKLMAAHLPTDLRDGSGFDALTEVEQRFIDHTIRHCFKALGITRSTDA